MKALEDYDWPGNVRELINVIERAVIVNSGTRLQLVGHIDSHLKTDKQVVTGLVEVERQHILKTLEEARWKIEGPGGAAQRLDMNPSTLRTRIKKLQIKRPETL